MARPSILARTCLLASVSIWSIGQHSVCGSVPTSVEVRPQATEVEQLINQLDIKASLTAGTWMTKTGNQNAPAEEWMTTTAGKSWSLESLAKAPSPSAGFALWCDGEDCYTLPDAVRFQNDTLTQGNFANFPENHYLLLLNLEPRQLIGCLGGLQLLDDTIINGVKYKHLHADLAKDPALLSDTATKTRTGLLPIVDLFIDLDRHAVAGVTLTDPAGFQYQTFVSSWNQFETSSVWPEKWVGRTFISGSSPLQETGTPVLTSLEKIKPTTTPDFSHVRDRMAKVPFFAGPLRNLRSVAFYQQELLTNSASQNDKVALIQASFNAGEARVGLEMWNQVAATLDSDSQEKLRHVIVPHAAYSLWTMPRTEDQVKASVGLMQKLLADLPGAEQKAVCLSFFRGWKNLYTQPSFRSALEPIDAALRSLFAKDGGPTVFSELVSLSQDPRYHKDLAAYLTAVAKLPLSQAGYEGSSLSRLVASSIVSGDIQAAKGYLESATWMAGTDDSRRARLKEVILAIDLATARDGGDQIAFTPIVTNFQTFNSGPYSSDEVTASAVTRLLELRGANLVASALGSGHDRIDHWIAESVTFPDAAVYWDQVIKLTLGQADTNPAYVVKTFGPIFKTYGHVFGKPQYEPDQWIHLGHRAEAYLGIEIQYLNKALVSTSEDQIRLAVVREIGGAYARHREFLAGVQAVEGAAQYLASGAAIAETEAIKDALRKGAADELEAAARQVKESQSADEMRLRVILSTKLAAVKAAGGSSEDIASIESAIHSLNVQKSQNVPN